MLVKWNPFYEFTRFEKDIEKVFNIHDFYPAVDVYEDIDKIIVEAEIPGIKPKDIEITLNKNVLTIGGKRIVEEDKRKYWRTERSAGSFIRSFTLPSLVEAEKIDASYNNGILKVCIPKKPEVVPRKIEIKSTE